jgi:hypothetical protein
MDDGPLAHPSGEDAGPPIRGVKPRLPIEDIPDRAPDHDAYNQTFEVRYNPMSS